MSFKITASEHEGSINLKASATVETREDAQALAAQFPKSLRIKASCLSTYDKAHYEKTGEYINEIKGYVVIQVSLRSTGVTGEYNETGAKRWDSFKRNCSKLGIELEYAQPFSNSLPADHPLVAV